MTDKQIILDYLEYLNDWEFEYKIHGINTPFGFIGARGDRNVRALIAAGKLEKKLEGKYRMVRYPQTRKGQLFSLQKQNAISL